jgi:hypothetical protein
MTEPVPLQQSDLDPQATIIRDFEPDELGSEGYTQFFHHHENSVLPVRDVTDTTGNGSKTEPCIERKAENYCSMCIQHILQSVARDPDRRYVFLFTRCRNNDLEQHYWEQYIIGYIDKRRALRIEDPQNPESDWISTQGPMKLVSFDDGLPLRRIDRPELPYFKNLSESQTQRVLDHLSTAENIYEDHLQRVEELETRVDRRRIWNIDPDAGRVGRTNQC